MYIVQGWPNALFTLYGGEGGPGCKLSAVAVAQRLSVCASVTKVGGSIPGGGGIEHHQQQQQQRQQQQQQQQQHVSVCVCVCVLEDSVCVSVFNFRGRRNPTTTKYNNHNNNKNKMSECVCWRTVYVCVCVWLPYVQMRAAKNSGFRSCREFVNGFFLWTCAKQWGTLIKLMVSARCETQVVGGCNLVVPNVSSHRSEMRYEKYVFSMALDVFSRFR